MRSRNVGRLLGGVFGFPGVRNCWREGEKLEASGDYILQPHVEIARGMYICTIEFTMERKV